MSDEASSRGGKRHASGKMLDNACLLVGVAAKKKVEHLDTKRGPSRSSSDRGGTRGKREELQKKGGKKERCTNTRAQK